MKSVKFSARMSLIAASGLFALGALAGPSNQLDFESLKAKCQELSSNQQLKPFKAVITCRDTQYQWRQVPSKQQQPHQNMRELGVSIRMKGYETPFLKVPVPLAATQTLCVEVEKWKITVPAVDTELFCDEMDNLKDLGEFCLNNITQRTAEDPSLIIEESTGERQSSCSPAVVAVETEQLEK